MDPQHPETLPVAETHVESAAQKPPERSATSPEVVATFKTEAGKALTPVASFEESPTAALQAKIVRLEATVAKFSTMQSEGAKQLLATRQEELAQAKAKLAGLTGGAETIPAAIAEAAPAPANVEATPSETDSTIKSAEQALQQLSGDASLALDQEFKSRQRLFQGAKSPDEKLKFAKHLLSFAEQRAAAKQKTEATIASAEATATAARAPEKSAATAVETTEDEATRAKRMRITEFKAGLDDVDINVYAQRKQLQGKIGAMNPSSLPDSLKYYASRVGKGSNVDDANFMAEAEAFLKTAEQQPPAQPKKAA